MTFAVSNEKAASRAALVIQKFDWRLFRRHFFSYWGFLVLAEFMRVRRIDGWTIVVTLLVMIPFASVAAWFAMRQKPYVEGDPIPKPRILKSIAVGLAICAAALGLSLALKQV